MQLENSFTVPGAADRVWDFMMDVERVAPCMPGAEITEAVDENNWKGKVSIKLGPVSLSFAGTLTREEVDEAGRRVVLKAKGQETRGKGMASATVTSELEEAEGGTKVVVVTDLQISGAAAQFGRGMIADVSQRFTREFAECLAKRIGGGATEGGDADGDESSAGEESSARPVSGIRLGIWAAFRALRRGLRRLLPGSSSG